jgi:hypothetical protein
VDKAIAWWLSPFFINATRRAQHFIIAEHISAKSFRRFLIVWNFNLQMS